jgi:hypothetical protein
MQPILTQTSNQASQFKLKNTQRSPTIPVNFNMPTVMNHSVNHGKNDSSVSNTGSTKPINPKLKESIKLNARKVVGASNIRNLIRSAATRDN